MKAFLFSGCFLVAGTAAALGADDDVLDRLDETLTWTALQDNARMRISGSIDLEGYVFQDPAPGLIYADGTELLNPRLTLFLDAQLGRRFYFFAQARVDRGFDPGKNEPRPRLDEYALRFTPSKNGALNIQIGKFATVVGNWVSRHHSWDNPFITAPLPYENLTGIFDSSAVNSVDALLKWADLRPGPPGSAEYFHLSRVPILWGPSYASGAAVTGAGGKFSYALEVKNASLSSRPAAWYASRVQWQHPTYSGRIGYHPNEMWQLGFSASAGSYLLPSARSTLVGAETLDDYQQIVFGQDISFAWHHLQFWAEAFEAKFKIPRVGDADVFGYYLEAKYKFTPQFFGAVRWNQQLYGSVPDGGGGNVQWGSNVWRVDLAPTYRFTPHLSLKLQYSLQGGGGLGPGDHSTLLAAQFTLRF